VTEPEAASAEPEVTPVDGGTLADLPVPQPAAEPDKKRAAEPDETPVGEPGEGPARAEPELTGHDAVDNSLRELTDAANLPPGEQIEAYEAAHRTLQETLRGIEQV
jgi:predicted component of type VI protein secretion system